MTKQVRSKRRRTAPPDQNLALIAVILGATSFIYSIFTGIPAIVVGIMALRKDSGNRLQAKIGIVLGVLGSLVIVALVLLLAYFFPTSFSEQREISDTDRQQITAIVSALEDYRAKNGNYPSCIRGTDDINIDECEEWKNFSRSNPDLPDYRFEYAADAFAADKEHVPGTLVYSPGSACLANRPIIASFVEGDESEVSEPRDYAALVYYYGEGRACFTAGVDVDYE